MVIRSHGQDGLIAEIDFLPNGWRRGSYNRIEGKISDQFGKVLYKVKWDME